MTSAVDGAVAGGAAGRGAERPGDLVVVATPGSAAGFRLAGTRTRVAVDAETARRLVEVEVARGPHGVVAVAAVLWAALPAPVRQVWQALTAPLVVPLPPEDGPGAAVRGAQVRDLLARSVGYEITFSPDSTEQEAP